MNSSAAKARGKRAGTVLLSGLLLLVGGLISEIAADEVVHLERSSPQQVDFRYRMTGQTKFELVKEGGQLFTRVAVPGCHTMREVGRPELPIRTVVIGIPAEGEFHLSARADEVDIRSLEAPLRVTEPDPRFPFAGDGVSSTTSVEREWVRLGAVGTFRGMRLVSVILQPVQLDPLRGELKIARELDVTLRMTGTGALLGGSPMRRPGPPDPWLSDLVLNYSSAREWLAPVSRAGAPQPGDYFDASDNWCRLELDQTGLYVLTYDDLLGAGIDPPEQIIPASLRIFSGGGLALPESLGVAPAEWMRECAIEVRSAGDSTFVPGDSIFFYGLGTAGWESEFDPDLDWETHVEHPYSLVNVYWLTWEEGPPTGAGFSEDPLRIPIARAPGSLGDPAYVDPDSAFYERLHFEENLIENFRTPAGDAWYWSNFKQLNRIKAFDIANPDPVLSRESRVRVNLIGHAEPLDTRVVTHFASVAVDDPSFMEHMVGAQSWVDESATTIDSAGHWLSSETDTSAIWIAVSDSCRRDTCRASHPEDWFSRDVYLNWIEVMYWRKLRARDDRLVFVSPLDSAGLASFSNVVEYPVSGFSDTTGIRVLDITDPYRVEEIDSWRITGSPGDLTLTVRDSLVTFGPRRYQVATISSLLTPVFMTLAHLPYAMEGEPLLRRMSGGVEYVIVTHSSLLPAARVLAAYRSQEMRVRVVTTRSVMDEFGWGPMDPTALRNFARYAYENWRDSPESPDLTYLLLLGDTSKDFLYRNSSDDPILVPSYEGRYLLESAPGALETDYATDDWFAYTDTSDVFADFAVGRMPVRTLSDAQFLVDMLIEYESDPEWGDWRNRIILAADDELRPSGGPPEFQHTRDCETLATYYLPHDADFEKIYLMEYPIRGGRKPDAAEALKDALDDGALLFHYIGHGDETRLADERLLEWDGTWSPANGLRRPVMVIFSCSVGKFDMPRNGLVEILLLQRGGGLSGAFTSTFLAFPQQNASLAQKFYPRLLGTRPAARLGEAARLAKADHLFSAPYDLTLMERYAVLGDPAMKVAWPRYEVRFESATSDSLIRRGKAFLTGSVYTESAPAGSVAVWLNGRAMVVVRSSADTTGHDYGGEENLHYEIVGPPVFSAEMSVVNGRFGYQVVPGEGEFFVAADAPAGVRGRIGCYLWDETAQEDAGGSRERLWVGGQATGGESDSVGPEISLLDAGGNPVQVGAEVLRGASLTAVFSDEHGINATGVDPFYTLGYQIDGGPWVDLTEGFRVDPGGFETGRVTFALLDTISLGDHELVLRAADNLNNRSRQELALTITSAEGFVLGPVFPYPNPFGESTVIVYELSQPAEVTVWLYTSAGRLIRVLRESGAEGMNSTLIWDGRDEAGDPVANGVYFMKLEARESTGGGKTHATFGRLARIR